MPPRWRRALVIVIAATGVVVGAFVPNALLPGVSGAATGGSVVASAAHQVPSDPEGCLETSCNKGAPAPATPPLATGALWTACVAVIAFAVARVTRRRRPRADPLPRGVVTPRFHPPRFA